VRGVIVSPTRGVEISITMRNELIDGFLAGPDPASALSQDGLLGELKKALLNRLMAAEFNHHLAQDRPTAEGKNHRNGSTRKRVLTDGSPVEVTTPRFSRSIAIQLRPCRCTPTPLNRPSRLRRSAPSIGAHLRGPPRPSAPSALKSPIPPPHRRRSARP
jgi:hypothetical protein